MDLGGPLCSRPRRAPAWLLASLLPGIQRWVHPIYHRRLLGYEGFDEEERYAIILGPPHLSKRLGPHPEVQLRSERLVRADALGRRVSLQDSRFSRRVSAGKWRDLYTRGAGIAATAASQEEARQASVKNWSTNCLWLRSNWLRLCLKYCSSPCLARIWRCWFLSRGWYFGPSSDLDGLAVWPIVAQQRAK